MATPNPGFKSSRVLLQDADRLRVVADPWRAESLLESAAAPMFAVDSDLRIRKINDAALRATGYSRAQIMGRMTCSELFDTDLCGTRDCTLRRCMEGRRDIHSETVMTARDGTRIPVLMCGSALIGPDGNEVLGGVAVVTDRADSPVSPTGQEILLDTLHSITAPMFVTDPDRKITTVNEAALEMCGYRREEVVGRMTGEDLTGIFVSPAERRRRSAVGLFGASALEPAQLRTRAGDEVPVLTACWKLADSGGTAYGMIQLLFPNLP